MNLDSVMQYRRDLHRIPELDFALPETCAYVKNILNQYSCTVFSPAKSAICAFFDCGREDTTAFRADMDALPIREENDAPYKSKHQGKMHACGHDGHTAMLLALAAYIDGHRAELPHNVLLIFQPAEETTGGAKEICDSGLFEKYAVKRIFGFHLWPNLPFGQVFSRRGALMAKSSEVTVRITGKSVHISKYAQGADAVFAACEFLHRVYAMEKNEVSENQVLKFGKISGGAVRNAIGDSAELLGSLRVFSAEAFAFMKKRCEEIGREIERETGCEIAVHFSEGYPPVRNDLALYDTLAAKGCAPEELAAPVMAAEDFSYYQQEIPGVFFFLGVGGQEELHSPRFDFNDSVLLRGVEFEKKLLYV